MRAARLFLVVAAVAGCTSTPEPPASFLVGLRVIAIVAQPPEIAAGQTSSLTVTAVDTTGATPEALWQRCVLPPLPGQAINPDCITNSVGPDFEELGTGLSINFTMPDTPDSALGSPDSTGGIYVPLIARVTSAAQMVVSDYRLRLAQAGQPPNQNPTIASVFVGSDGADGGAVMPLEPDPAPPLVVHAGQRLALGVTFAPGSAETYTVNIAGAPPRTATETLTTSWFTTAGDLNNKKTSDTQPTTILQLDKRLPSSGARIDIYAVSRDERGGTDVAHRSLELQ